MRPSSVAIVAGIILAGFTVWITRQAKALERDLDGSSQKIVLLDKPAPDFRLTTIRCECASRLPGSPAQSLRSFPSTARPDVSSDVQSPTGRARRANCESRPASHPQPRPTERSSSGRALQDPTNRAAALRAVRLHPTPAQLRSSSLRC